MRMVVIILQSFQGNRSVYKGCFIMRQIGTLCLLSPIGGKRLAFSEAADTSYKCSGASIHLIRCSPRSLKVKSSSFNNSSRTFALTGGRRDPHRKYPQPFAHATNVVGAPGNGYFSYFGFATMHTHANAQPRNKGCIWASKTSPASIDLRIYFGTSCF